jgi:hypothetical protein
VRNGFAAARAYSSSALRGLWGKLQGRPGTYQGLWIFLAQLYARIEAGESPPIGLDQIIEVNELVDALLEGAEPRS